MKQIASRFAVLAILISCLSLPAFAETNFTSAQITRNGLYQIEGNWSELKHGWSKLVLKISNQNQQLVAGAKVNVAYEMIGMPMNPPNKPVVDMGDGTYEKQVFIGMKGTWQFDITVDSNAEQDTLSSQQNIMQ